MSWRVGREVAPPGPGPSAQRITLVRDGSPVQAVTPGSAAPGQSPWGRTSGRPGEANVKGSPGADDHFYPCRIVGRLIRHTSDNRNAALHATGRSSPYRVGPSTSVRPVLRPRSDATADSWRTCPPSLSLLTAQQDDRLAASAPWGVLAHQLGLPRPSTSQEGCSAVRSEHAVKQVAPPGAGTREPPGDARHSPTVVAGSHTGAWIRGGHVPAQQFPAGAATAAEFGPATTTHSAQPPSRTTLRAEPVQRGPEGRATRQPRSPGRPDFGGSACSTTRMPRPGRPAAARVCIRRPAACLHGVSTAASGAWRLAEGRGPNGTTRPALRSEHAGATIRLRVITDSPQSGSSLYYST